jgi:hypothetical protein
MRVEILSTDLAAPGFTDEALSNGLGNIDKKSLDLVQEIFCCIVFEDDPLEEHAKKWIPHALPFWIVGFKF